MERIILDTNIILRYPKILGLQDPNFLFIIPLAVMRDLKNKATQRGAGFDRRINLIKEASVQGTVKIVSTEKEVEEYQNSDIFPYADQVDAAVVALAITYKGRGYEVKIATLDTRLQKIASNNQIDILGKDEIEKLLAGFTVK